MREETVASHEAECTYWLTRALQQAGNGTRNETGMWLARQFGHARFGEARAGEVMAEYAGRVAQARPGEAVHGCRSDGNASLRVQPVAARAPAQIISGEAADDLPILPLDDAGELPEITPDPLPPWAAEYGDAERGQRGKHYAAHAANAAGYRVHLPAKLQRRDRGQLRGAALPLCRGGSGIGRTQDGDTRPHRQAAFRVAGSNCSAAREEKAAEAEAKRRLAEKKIRELEREYGQVSAMGDGAEKQRLQGEIVKLTLANPQPGALPQLLAEDFTVAASALRWRATANRCSSLRTKGACLTTYLGDFPKWQSLIFS